MKGGVNIWVALRDTLDTHRAWIHVDRPYTELDMPRPINEPAKPAASRPEGADKAANGAARDIAADATAKVRDQIGAAGPKARAPSKSAIERAIEAESLAEAKGFGGAVML
jgi:hypothetical protein